MKLWLARHAQPRVAPGICYGRRDVPALCEATQAAAQALCAALPAKLSVRVSGLSRAGQLARALAVLRPDLRFTVDGRLNEMDFGAWEGVPWAGIPKQAIDAWTADFARHRFGGKESVSEVLRRVASALGDDTSDEAAWITHAGVIRAVFYLIQYGQATPVAANWPREAPAFGAWTVVSYHRAP